MTIMRNGVWLVLLVWVFCFHHQARGQTNVYTMPPGEVRAAKATAFILNGSLSFIHVDDGGAGYASPPNVAIVLTSGSGSGAVVMATVANGAVTGLTIQNPGSYSSPRAAKVALRTSFGGASVLASRFASSLVPPQTRA